MGHEGQFASPRLSDRSAFSEETFAGRPATRKIRREQPFGCHGSNESNRPTADLHGPQAVDGWVASRKEKRWQSLTA